MDWFSTALDFVFEAAESEVFSSVASAAASAAATYAMAEMFGSDSVPTPLASVGTTAGGADAGADAEAALKTGDESRGRRGHGDTILTGPQGLINDDELEIARATLLGG